MFLLHIQRKKGKRSGQRLGLNGSIIQLFKGSIFRPDLLLDNAPVKDKLFVNTAKR